MRKILRLVPRLSKYFRMLFRLALKCRFSINSFSGGGEFVSFDMIRMKDRIHSEQFLERLGIESVAAVVRRGRLRWFVHVERMPGDYA